MELQLKKILGRRRQKIIPNTEKNLDPRDPPARIVKIASQAPSTKTTIDTNTEVPTPDSLPHPGNTLGLLPGTRREVITRTGRKMRSEMKSGMRARVGKRRMRRGKNEKEKRLNSRKRNRKKPRD